MAVGVGVVVIRAGRDRWATRRREQDRRLGLRSGERAADGVKRMALTQLDLAAEMLEAAARTGADEHAVHEARKALKRLRALLMLVRAEIGEQAFARERTVVRNAARALAGARDAEVMLATLDALIARRPGKLAGRGGIQRIRTRLAGERDQARRAMQDERSEREAALAALRACRTRAGAWELPDGGATKLLEPGLLRIYRLGRSRYRRAARRRGRDMRRMHEWRKRVKDLRYVSEMMDPPGRRSRLARQVDELGELLGEDHDLGVLDAWLREQSGKRDGRGPSVGRRSAKTLRRHIARRRRMLQRKILRRGERIYGVKPKKFLRRSRALRRRAAKSR
jgi:CHAD domain-containing protein